MEVCSDFQAQEIFTFTSEGGEENIEYIQVRGTEAAGGTWEIKIHRLFAFIRL